MGEEGAHLVLGNTCESVALASVPLMGVPLNVGLTLSCGLQLHKQTVVPFLLPSDAAVGGGRLLEVFWHLYCWSEKVMCSASALEWSR